MNRDAMSLRIGIVAAVGLLATQIIWHGWLAPSRPNLLWPSLAIAIVPLLPGLWVARTMLRRGLLICGIVSLFYFSHGVAELWNGSAPRWLSALEVLLSLVVIATLGWDARGYKRAKGPRGADIGATSREA